MNSYELSRVFWDFSFSNPEKIKPYHSAIYFFAIEHCNRLGWKEKFGFPTSMVLEATGIRSYSAYKKHLDDLVGWGLITMIEYSKNQYSSNVIALTLKVKALDKALDKALIKHSTKQSESTVQSIDSIIKQINNKQITINQLNNKQIVFLKNFLNEDVIKSESEVKIDTPKEKDFPIILKGEEDIKKGETLFVRIKDIYFAWYKKQFKIKPQFDGIDGKGIKIIIKYFSENDEENKGDIFVIESFNHILLQYDKWKPFHKGRTRVREIASDISNIINDLNYGTGKQTYEISEKKKRETLNDMRDLGYFKDKEI